jgi:hypothetical protein
MFENMFHKFTPRAYALEQESKLAMTFLTGNTLAAIFALVMGAILLYYHFIKSKKNPKGMRLYLPLGSWFIALGVHFVLNIISVWYNYLWLITLSTLIIGLAGFWCLVLIPVSITERKNLRDCDSLREDFEAMQDKLRIQEGVIENLRKNPHHGINSNPV